MELYYLLLVVAFALLVPFNALVSAYDPITIGLSVSCAPGRLYCGTEITPFVKQREKARNKTLYECDSYGKSFIFSTMCDVGCKAFANGRSSCLCFPNKLYCGRDLYGVGAGSYDEDSLYSCDNSGFDAKVIQICAKGCDSAAPLRCLDISCSEKELMCGYRLKALGWLGYFENDTLYECGSSALFVPSRVRCARGTCVSDRCQCEPYRYYCGEELYKSLGWTAFHGYASDELLQCTANGSAVTRVGGCSVCITRSPTICECEPDVPCAHECQPRTKGSWCPCLRGYYYCGHELAELGWYGYSNQTLYKCAHENDVTRIEACQSHCNGTLRFSSCDGQCLPDHGYCGYELNESYMLGDYENQTYYLCNYDGKGAAVLYNCTRGSCDTDGCTCESKAQYCGHELLSWGEQEYESDWLYECDRGDFYNVIRACRLKCVADSKRPPYCANECDAGSFYCGHELKAAGIEGYFNDGALYACDSNGVNATFWLLCTSGLCAHGKCTCEPGRYYCGRELNQTLGWNDINDLDQLLQCGLNGTSTRTINADYLCPACVSNLERSTCVCDLDSTCKPECRPRTNISWCECEKGVHYCGHELISALGWQGYLNHTHYECVSGNNVKTVRTCASKCVAAGGYSGCSGQCNTGANYCGRVLQKFGLEVDDYDGLYECGLDGTRVTVRRNCTKGKCARAGCKCDVGRYYCGYELYDHLGWEEFKTRPTDLLKCIKDGLQVDNGEQDCSLCVAWDANVSCQCDTGSDCNSNCRPMAASSWCKCNHGALYCGHELFNLGWQDYLADVIYECDGGNNVKVVDLCDSGCGENGVCKSPERCVPDSLYCGFTLNDLGFYGSYRDNALYKCASDGDGVKIWYDCEHGCEQNTCKCEPERYYCGYELFELGWAAYKKSAPKLVQCLSNGAWTRTVNNGINCPNCIGAFWRSNCTCSPNLPCSHLCRPRTNTSWCECDLDGYYCGHELYKLGWQDYENNTVYQCNGGNNVRIVQACPGECRHEDGTLGCAADCIVGNKYCASKLLQMGYQEIYNESALYLCNESRSPLVNTGETSPQCGRKCTLDKKYCGFSLQYSHDIPLSNMRNVYKCQSDGSIESTAACSVCIDNDGNAYCGAPWYWYFLGVTLSLVFIGLALVLIRTARKHRRLQKSIEAQRIDSNHLETSTLLGKGEFGEVWLAVYKPSYGGPLDVALKLSNEITEPTRKLACANCFFQEVIALNVLTYENIIKAFGVCTNYKDRFGNTVPALVLEYMNGGSAISYLRSERQRLVERDLLQILIDISQAGDHLCKMGIIHRDIAARNILIQKDVASGRVKLAKLTDFGLAKDIGKKVSMYKSTHPERATIPFRYTAPEAFAGSFSSKSDVWAFGIVIWELYSILDEDIENGARSGDPGPTPYVEIENHKDLFDELCMGLRLKQPRTATDGTYRKMVECWNMKPESRPSFEDLIRFFSSKRGAGNSPIVVQNAQRIAEVEAIAVGNGEEIEMRSYEDSGYVSPDPIRLP